MIGLPAFHSAQSELSSAVICRTSSEELIASPLTLSNIALVAASARALAVRMSDPASILIAAALALSPKSSAPEHRSAIAS